MSFRLYLDEHIAPDILRLLRQRGHDVESTQEAGLAAIGTPDEDQLVYATSQSRVILTYDVADFVDLAKLWADSGKQHAGIIVAHRLPAAPTVIRLERLSALHPDGIANMLLWL